MNSISFQHLKKSNKGEKKERKEALQQEEEMKQVASEKDVKDMQQKEDEKKDEPYDPDKPMMRAPYVFGGLINDLKRRFKLKHFLSDFKDGIDAQVFAAAIFIYFAALSGAIAFTENGHLNVHTDDDWVYTIACVNARGMGYGYTGKIIAYMCFSRLRIAVAL